MKHHLKFLSKTAMFLVATGALILFYACNPGNKMKNASSSLADSIKSKDSTENHRAASLVLNRKNDTTQADTSRKNFLLPFVQRHLTFFPYREKGQKGWCGLYKFPSPKLLYTSQTDDSVKKIVIKIYNAGKIISGVYKNASYNILRIDVAEKGKNEQLLLRFLKTSDSTLVLLPKLSSPNIWYRIITPQKLVIPDRKLLGTPPFKGIKETYADNTVNVSNFASPKNILNGTYVLNRFLYVPEVRPLSFLQNVKDNLYSSANTTVKNLQQLIRSLETPANYTTDSASFEQYLQMNAYYYLHNDGTILIYTPVWNKTEFTVDEKTFPASHEYNLQGKYSRTGLPASFAMLIDSSSFFRGHHLKIVGQTNTGAHLYFIKEINSSFLDKLYSFYLKTYKWYFREEPYKQHKYTFEEFLREYPVLFWKDKFNRWYCASKKKFLPIHYNKKILN